MRFPPRLVLAASVLGMLAASSGAVLMMPENTDETPVPVPELTAATEPQAPAPAGPATPAAAGPAITGEQIAALALAPARDRAATLIAERAQAEAAAEAARAAADGDEDSDSGERRDQWRELRDEIREACTDGRIRGPICRE